METKQHESWTGEHQLHGVAWVAKLLGVSKSWVYQAAASGVLPVIRIGSSLRFRKKDIAAWTRGETAKSVKLPSCR